MVLFMCDGGPFTEFVGRLPGTGEVELPQVALEAGETEYLGPVPVPAAIEVHSAQTELVVAVIDRVILLVMTVVLLTSLLVAKTPVPDTVGLTVCWPLLV